MGGGTKSQVDVSPETPLLWVLRDNLGITSVKYACGIAECGVCTVLVDDEAVRSCSITVDEAVGSSITTVEGLADDHPVKVAWIEKQVPQCDYCQPGIPAVVPAIANAVFRATGVRLREFPFDTGLLIKEG